MERIIGNFFLRIGSLAIMSYKFITAIRPKVELGLGNWRGKKYIKKSL